MATIPFVHQEYETAWNHVQEWDASLLKDDITGQLIAESLRGFAPIISKIKCAMMRKRKSKEKTKKDETLEAIPQYDHVNRCIECGVDMGSSNPRQFCRKTYCENI